MLSETQRDEAAEALYNAHLNHQAIPSLTDTYSDLEVSDAYAIAQGVSRRRLDAGHQIKGHKVGLTSKAMRAWANTHEPDYGTLFDEWFLPESSVADYSTMFKPAVEIELAFVMKDRLEGPSVNAADVIRATDFVLPALEIVDSRFSGEVKLLDSIADAASFGYIVLGGNPRTLTDIDIRSIGGTLMINGDIAQTGVSSAVMGNPINAVSWLANKLHTFGTSIEAGHVVLSGSFIGAERLNQGDTVTAQFDQFGDVSIAIG